MQISGKDAGITITKDSGIGEKIMAARRATGITLRKLSEKTGLTERSIKYYETGDRVPSMEAVSKLAEAFGLGTDYFMDPVEFEKQLSEEKFLAEVTERYGARGKAQARRLLQQTSSMFAGGELSEEDEAAFIEEMQEIFMDSKERARRKYGKKD